MSYEDDEEGPARRLVVVVGCGLHCICAIVLFTICFFLVFGGAVMTGFGVKMTPSPQISWVGIVGIGLLVVGLILLVVAVLLVCEDRKLAIQKEHDKRERKLKERSEHLARWTPEASTSATKSDGSKERTRRASGHANMTDLNPDRPRRASVQAIMTDLNPDRPRRASGHATINVDDPDRPRRPSGHATINVDETDLSPDRPKWSRMAGGNAIGLSNGIGLRSDKPRRANGNTIIHVDGTRRESVQRSDESTTGVSEDSLDSSSSSSSNHSVLEPVPANVELEVGIGDVEVLY